MAVSAHEIINGILYVTGSLDRSSDQEFEKALERYAETTPPANRVVDMSNVRWLVPTGAKALIMAAQNASEKGGKLRVLASKHVMQTLNLLGAKTWLTIETCLTPNPKPVAGQTHAPAHAAPAAPLASSSNPDLVPIGESFTIFPLPGAAAPSTTTTAAGAAATTAPPVLPHAGSPANPAAIPAKPRSGLYESVSTALAGPTEELSRGAVLLRILHANRRYQFSFPGNETIIGIVRERVGGSWILVDTGTTRKIVNLDLIQYCEIL